MLKKLTYEIIKNLNNNVITVEGLGSDDVKCYNINGELINVDFSLLSVKDDGSYYEYYNNELDENTGLYEPDNIKINNILYKNYIDEVDIFITNMLDKKAQEYMYDDIKSAKASYNSNLPDTATETMILVNQEAYKFCIWDLTVWSELRELNNKYLDGEAQLLSFNNGDENYILNYITSFDDINI